MILQITVNGSKV